MILSVPMGLAKLIDILLDNRDFVRNEVLLLLIQLTKSNANIQNIIAYERGFDQLFQVIRNEGFSDGGIVVDDSLQLMLNLLKRNISNQTVFREGESTRSLPRPNSPVIDFLLSRRVLHETHHPVLPDLPAEREPARRRLVFAENQQRSFHAPGILMI